MKKNTTLFATFGIAITLIIMNGCVGESGKTTTETALPNAVAEETTVDFSQLSIQINENSVVIGTQEWMRKNLDVDRFRNGDRIAGALNNEQWEKKGEELGPVWGYYNNDKEHSLIYGKIYNWFAVADERGICPQGWRVPSTQDWNILADYLGGAEVAGYHLKADQGWADGGSGSGKSGFDALPSGFKGYEGNSYSHGNLTNWWSIEQQGNWHAFARTIYGDSPAFVENTGYKMDGFSVRCIRE